MPPRDDKTARDDASQQVPVAGPLLLVVGEGTLSTHALAPGGTLVLGRDAACDVVLDHPKISRRHATVASGPPPTVEDGGSTNGVTLGGRKLGAGERVALIAGASFQLGPFTALFLGQPSGAGESVAGRAALVVRDPRADAQSEVIVRVARSDVSLLVRGETGVGKEVLARTIHALSGRAGPLLGINCAALSESLLESELFGHERGAFTGAVQARPGLFEAAAGGTVFLDEVGDLPLGVQAKMLRAIEARQVIRVGGVRPVDLDVRFIAATHRDLNADVATGAFRKDLYFRLNGVTLVVPPLRSRREAIPALANQFLADAAARAGRIPVPRLAPDALAVIGQHDWPGNVRELKAVIERAVLIASGDEIGPRHLLIDEPVAPPAPPAAGPATPATWALDPAAAIERDRIVAALEACAGNQTHAARELGMSRATLVTKLGLYRIPRPRRK
jgi:two-component system response regulator AtoC